MGILAPVLDSLDILGFALLGLCLAMGLWKIPLYFRALRPRKGTTEWMAKVDGAHFAPLGCQKLGWMDGPWFLLGGLLGAVLHLFALVFSLDLYQNLALFEYLLEIAPFLLGRLLLAGALGGILYLLLRLLFAKPLPALCIAALSGLALDQNLDTALFLSLSLLLLYAWMAREEEKGLFPGGLLLFFAMLSYTAAVFSAFASLCLLPFFLGAYLWKQVRRFRRGKKEGRVGRVLLSLFLSLLCAGLCLFLYALALGLVSSSLVSSGLELSLLRRLDFYSSLVPLVKVWVTLNLGGLRPVCKLSGEELLSLLWCLPGLFLLLHGLLSRRQSPCLWLTLLLPGLIFLWLLGGTGLLSLPLLLCLGYAYAVLGQRGKSGWALLGSVIFGSFLGIFTVIY